jgi:hypothetical protein
MSSCVYSLWGLRDVAVRTETRLWVSKSAGTRVLSALRNVYSGFWGPFCLFFCGYRSSLVAVNRPGREVDRSPPSSVEVWSCTCTSAPLYAFMVSTVPTFLYAINRCQNVVVGVVSRLRDRLFGVQITAGAIYIDLLETDLRPAQTPSQWVSGALLPG